LNAERKGEAGFHARTSGVQRVESSCACEHTRLAVDAAGLGTWELNPLTKERRWSARCRELAGLSEGEEITAERFARAVHPDDRERVEEAIAQALDPDSGGEYRVEFRTVGAVERWVASTGKSFFENRRAVRLIGTMQDITERKKAEREREIFLGALGHDLRTPLSTIMIHSVLLQRRSGITEPFDRITGSAKRMARMIDDLVDFARSRAGELQIHRASLDLVDVCKEALYGVALAHPGRPVEVSQVGDTRGAWDGDRIGQVIQNLVLNALAYGAPGSPVRIAIEGVGDAVGVAVSNHGLPIPAEAREHLFDPFRRGRQEGKGAGLGLYIVRQIVTAHHGTVSFESDETVTVFRLRLPRG
jgi:PAS domain S-box-containing protein